MFLRRSSAPSAVADARAAFTLVLVLALAACGSSSPDAAVAEERAQVEALATAVQEATGEAVELAYVDQGYTGEDLEAAAAKHGIQLEVVKHTEAKKGFVLLPRRWVVERSFAWMSRFRRLARNYERLPETFAVLDYVALYRPDAQPIRRPAPKSLTGSSGTGEEDPDPLGINHMRD